MADWANPLGDDQSVQVPYRRRVPHAGMLPDESAGADSLSQRPGPRLVDRIQDDTGAPTIENIRPPDRDPDAPTLMRPGEHAGPSPMPTPSDMNTDRLVNLIHTVGQQASTVSHPTGKQRLIHAIMDVAPVVAGAIGGGAAGATGAGEGVLEQRGKEQGQATEMRKEGMANQRSLMQEVMASQRNDATIRGQDLQGERLAQTLAGRANVAGAGVQGRLDLDQQKAGEASDLEDQKQGGREDLANINNRARMQLELSKENNARKLKNLAPIPGNFIPVNNAKGDTTGWVDPKAVASGRAAESFVPASAVPGLAAATGGATDAGGGPVIPPKPTAATQNMAQTAQGLVPIIEDAQSMMKTARDQLGPGMGRWNDFATGKLGFGNVTFSSIKDQLDFVATGVNLVHSRGRTSQIIYEQFKDMYGKMSQSPDNIDAALRIGKNIISGYATMRGIGDQAKAPAAGAGGGFAKWKSAKGGA